MTLFIRNILASGIPALLALLLSFVLNYFNLLINANSNSALICLTLLAFVLNLVYAGRAGKENFTQLLIVVIVIKLLLALSCIVVYSLADKPGFFNFSIRFIFYYILFTIFEIRYLLYIIKTHPLRST